MRVRVPNAGEIGIVRDVQDIALPANVWTNGQNVVMRDGSVHSVKGREEVFASPTIKPSFAFQFEQPTEKQWCYVGWDAVGASPAIYTINEAGTHTDRTSTLTSVETDTWDGCAFGSYPILTNNVDTPQYWDGSAGTFADLPDFPASTQCKIIRAFRNFIVIGNVTESSTNYANVIRWSNAADVGALPDSYDYTDPATLAGRVELSEDGGPIVDMLELRGIMYIYRESATHAMQYVKGNYVFSLSRRFTGWGVMSKNCVVEVDGQHYCFTDHDLLVHNGTTVKSIVDSTMRRFIFDALDASNKDACFVVANQERGEVWFCYPQLGATYATKAFVFNTKTGTSGTRELPGLIYATSGYVPRDADDIWNNNTATWHELLQTWSESTSSTSKFSIVSLTYEGKKFYQEDFGYSNDGANLQSFIERENLLLPKFNPADRVTIKAVYPQIETIGEINVKIYVGAKEKQKGGLIWSGPYEFNPFDDHKISTRTTGRFPAIRFLFTGKGQWRLSGYDVEVQPRGGR